MHVCYEYKWFKSMYNYFVFGLNCSLHYNAKNNSNQKRNTVVIHKLHICAFLLGILGLKILFCEKKCYCMILKYCIVIWLLENAHNTFSSVEL